MEIKYNSENNVCEYYNENNGSIIHVLSGDRGLWFNINDTFKMFGMIKSSKLWFAKNLSDEEKRWVEFYRKGRKSKEAFIPEQAMHNLIAKIRGDFNDNIDFIYGIITDYDKTCINIKDVNLNVEERIALHALKAESDNYVNRTEQYLDILNGKTHLGEYYELFNNELNNRLESSEMKYDNEICPEDLRQEKLKAEQTKRDIETRKRLKYKSDYAILSAINKELENGMDVIYNFINRCDMEEYDEIEEFEMDDEIPYEIYDGQYIEFEEYKEDANYVRKVIQEKLIRQDAFIQAIDNVEKSAN
jgi:hypothetical protein